MIDMFDSRTMIQALDLMVPTKTFLRDMFFKRIETFNTKTVDIDIRKGSRRVASYVSPTDPAHISERVGYETKTYIPPYIKEKRGISPADLLFNREFGSNIYDTVNPNQRMANMIAKDLTEMNEMITRAEEIQCKQALFDGQVIFRTNSEKVVFPVSADHKIETMTTYWDESGGKPIDDLKAWRKIIMRDSGMVPNVIIMGTKAADAFLENPQLAPDTGRQSSISIDRGSIQPELYPNGATYIGHLRDVNCDIWSYDEWYQDETGALQAIVPENKIFFGSTNARMDRLYGVIQDLAGLAAVARFPKSWVQEDPSMRFIELQSAPLMVPHEVDTYVVATVIAPEEG